MKPKKYPYSGVAQTNKTTREGKLELVVFPNIAIRKDLLKHVWTTTKNHDNSTILYFRIPKLFCFGYEEQRAKVNLSYEETLKIINGA